MFKYIFVIDTLSFLVKLPPVQYLAQNFIDEKLRLYAGIS